MNAAQETAFSPTGRRARTLARNAGPAYDENQIYDNVFVNLDAGCMVEGDHRGPPPLNGQPNPGLQMLCGDHFDCGADQLMKYLVTPTMTRIKEVQGSDLGVDYAANNTFNKDLTGVACGSLWEVYVDPNLPSGPTQWPDDDVAYYWFDNSANPEMRPECVEMNDLFHTPESSVGYDYQLEPVGSSGIVFDKEVHCDQGVLDDVPQEPGSHMAAY